MALFRLSPPKHFKVSWPRGIGQPYRACLGGLAHHDRFISAMPRLSLPLPLLHGIGGEQAASRLTRSGDHSSQADVALISRNPSEAGGLPGAAVVTRAIVAMGTLDIDGKRHARRSGRLRIGRLGRLEGGAELHGLEVLG